MTNAEYVEKYPERFKDELDKWLFKEFGILGGCCSSIEELKYSVARKVAKKAMEIAREETYNKIWNWLAKHINDYVVEGDGRDIDLMFDDIKQAMKDECI